MKTIAGKPKFDSVFLGEVRLGLLSYPQVHMEVTAGYSDSKSGQRFGSLSLLGGWSPATLAKLGEFLEALEQDVASMVFEGTTIDSGQVTASPTAGGIPEL